MLGIFLKRYGNKQLSAVVLLVVVFLLPVGVFLFWREEATAPDDAAVTVVGEGIEVVQEGNTQVIRNEGEGYELSVVEVEKIISEPGYLLVDLNDVVQDGVEGGGYYPSITILSHQTSSTVEEEAEQWISQQQEPEFYSFESQKDDTGRTYVVVFDNAFFGGPKPYVFFVHKQMLYFIDASFVDPKEVIRSLTFL